MIRTDWEPRYVALLAFVVFAVQPARAQTPLGSDFTYQGQLKGSGVQSISNADFQFSLFDAVNGGNQVGTTQNKTNVGIVNGLFTISLDFGPSAFNGNACWIEVAVRSPAGSGGFTTLTPRQPITGLPQTQFAVKTRGISVDANDNVGIGTTTPGKKLTVAGDMELGTSSGDYRHMRIGGGNSDGFLYGSFPALGDGIHIGYNYFADAAGNHHDINSDGGRSRLSLGYGTIALATICGSSCSNQQPKNRLVVNESGKVGIGTSSPQSTLDVNGDVHCTEGYSTNNSYRYVGNNGDTLWQMGALFVQNFGLQPFLRMFSPVTGDIQAQIYRDSQSGNGIISADEKNFRAPNPADPMTDIWYCCIEGPEAAMYVRGTARLTNGRARIELPDHFRNLAAEPVMTVQLTPLSIESKGLALIRKSLEGIEIGEMGGGAGNYEFDWRVEAVRKGHEEYKVIRPWMRSDPDEGKAWQNRLKWIEERKAHGKP